MVGKKSSKRGKVNQNSNISKIQFGRLSGVLINIKNGGGGGMGVKLFL